MKIGCISTLDGYCTRRQRLASVDNAILKRIINCEKQSDKIVVEDAIDDITQDRKSTQSLYEMAQAIRAAHDKIAFQGIEAEMRKKITNARYFFQSITPFQAKREERLAKVEAGLDKKSLVLRRMEEQNFEEHIFDDVDDNFSPDFEKHEEERLKIQKFGERLKAQYDNLDDRRTTTDIKYYL